MLTSLAPQARLETLLGRRSQWTIRGLRYTVESILDLMSAGMTVDEVLADAQLPARLADFLNRAGHDTLHTIGLPDGNR